MKNQQLTETENNRYTSQKMSSYTQGIGQDTV